MYVDLGSNPSVGATNIYSVEDCYIFHGHPCLWGWRWSCLLLLKGDFQIHFQNTFVPFYEFISLSKLFTAVNKDLAYSILQIYTVVTQYSFSSDIFSLL